MPTFHHFSLISCLSNALDRPSNQFFPSVCVSVNRHTDRIGSRTITSTILYRFSPNFACGSEMWSHRRLLFVRQTGSSLPILEVCGFRFRQFSGSGCFQQISTKSHVQIKFSNADFISVVNETRNRNWILEMYIFHIWFRLVHCGTITLANRYGFLQILHSDQKCDRCRSGVLETINWK